MEFQLRHRGENYKTARNQFGGERCTRLYGCFHAWSFLRKTRGNKVLFCCCRRRLVLWRCSRTQHSSLATINAPSPQLMKWNFTSDVYDKTMNIALVFVTAGSVHKSSFCHCKTPFYVGIDIVKCAFYWMIDFQSKPPRRRQQH